MGAWCVHSLLVMARRAEDLGSMLRVMARRAEDLGSMPRVRKERLPVEIIRRLETGS